jgi:hypothetical protein
MNFPILRLMKSDFIGYYKKRNEPVPKDNFKKLVFLYDLSSSGGTYNANLLCYALERDRDIMNPSPIKLIDGHDGVVTINRPFMLGDTELPYLILKELIGPFDHINTDFDYLRFEALVNSDGFLVFEVYYNNSHVAPFYYTIPNPCPPAKQD